MLLQIEKGDEVPTYILLSSLNPGGLETLKERPDRLLEVNQEIERMGGHIKDSSTQRRSRCESHRDRP